MKRCPECRRDYYDETLLYCLDDGTPLLEGPATAGTEDAGTKILPSGEAPTQAQIHSTDASKPLVAKSSNRRMFVIPAVAVFLIICGFFGYRYFSGRVAAKQIESIAVMPFVNDSGDPNIEYLSDGMTEMLINSLSQVPNLQVKARSSVFRYKGREIDPKKVGPELNVQAILNGHVIQRGDQISLNLELVDAVTETVIWGTKYERKLVDLVGLQSDVARDVSAKLKTKLSGASEKQVTKEYTSDPEAYQLYLKGIYHWNKRTQAELDQAIELFQQAIAKDPGYAKAYGGLAIAYEVYGSNSAITEGREREVALKAKAAAQKALELDNDLAEAHAVLAERKVSDEWDFVGSEASYKKAIELNPNFASAHQWYSEVLSRLGRHEEAIAEIQKAHEIDPFSRAVNMNIGLRLLEMRRYDEAMAQFEQLVRSEPDYPMAHAFLGGIHAQRGEFDLAMDLGCKAEVLLKIETPETCAKKKIEVGKAVKDGGREGYWRYILADELRRYERGENSAVDVASAYAELNEKEKSFEWLEKAFAAHSSEITYLKIDYSFDSIRADPRFNELLRRIGLPV